MLLAALAIVAPAAACSRQPEVAPQTAEPAVEEQARQPATSELPQAATTVIDLADLLAELEGRYSAATIATTLETLPVLLRYFESEKVTSGELAASAHWQSLSAEARAGFAEHLRQVFGLCELIQELTVDLSNGYHDVAYALPESRALYLPILEQYGLDSQTATSYDIASSLSTYHESAIQVEIASMLAELPEGERTDYLRRLREGARQGF
jgi:hypothetical protein